MSPRSFFLGVLFVGCSEEEAPLGVSTLPPAGNRPADPGLSFDFACTHSGAINNPIKSGSRPLTGIPALIDPNFLPADQVTYLGPDDWVFGVEIEGRFLCFPAKILNYHEVVSFSVDSYRYAASW